MAHNADSFAAQGKGQNAHLREKPRDMAMTSGVGAVAHRLRVQDHGHES
jgi:hypothetical protein